MDPLKEKAAQVYLRLLDVYGEPVWRVPLEPLDELVSTILSQNTNDRNRDVAFNRLRAAFPTWEAVREAPQDAVIAAIRPAGLANQKGPRIQQVLREITNLRRGLDLTFLSRMEPEDARAWLTQFKGVGLKTAAIVMQFALSLPAFPVDTHIYRVSGRLGLRPAAMNVDQAHMHLAGLFEPDTYGPAHLNLIRLGREVCAARSPCCPVCPVSAWCEYFHHLPANNEGQTG
ncbi:MAG: endonuclease III [Anaerolineaceae bacterium]